MYLLCVVPSWTACIGADDLLIASKVNGGQICSIPLSQFIAEPRSILHVHLARYVLYSYM